MNKRLADEFDRLYEEWKREQDEYRFVLTWGEGDKTHGTAAFDTHAQACNQAFRMWGNVYGLREAEIIFKRLRRRGSAELDGNWFKIASPKKTH